MTLFKRRWWFKRIYSTDCLFSSFILFYITIWLWTELESLDFNHNFFLFLTFCPLKTVDFGIFLFISTPFCYLLTKIARSSSGHRHCHIKQSILSFCFRWFQQTFRPPPAPYFNFLLSTLLLNNYHKKKFKNIGK